MGANNPEIVKLIESINRAGTDIIEIIGFVDNANEKHGQLFMGYPVLGSPTILQQDRYCECCIINNITRDCQVREATTKQLIQYNDNFIRLIHPDIDTRFVEIGKGTIVYDGTIISPRSKIKDHCALMLRSTVAHDCVLGDYCFLGPGVVINGFVNIQDRVYVGSGAIILPRLTIGDSASIGAGSVVATSIEPGTSVWGNPARKRIFTEQKN